MIIVSMLLLRLQHPSTFSVIAYSNVPVRLNQLPTNVLYGLLFRNMLDQFGFSIQLRTKTVWIMFSIELLAGPLAAVGIHALIAGLSLHMNV